MKNVNIHSTRDHYKQAIAHFKAKKTKSNTGLVQAKLSWLKYRPLDTDSTF